MLAPHGSAADSAAGSDARMARRTGTPTKKAAPDESGARVGPERWCSLPYSIAARNQLVSEVGCVMPVPTTTAQAPASMAVLASAGVWTCPSQMIG